MPNKKNDSFFILALIISVVAGSVYLRVTDSRYLADIIADAPKDKQADTAARYFFNENSWVSISGKQAYIFTDGYCLAVFNSETDIISVSSDSVSVLIHTQSQPVAIPIEAFRAPFPKDLVLSRPLSAQGITSFAN
jgi:archaellum component FlaG (FlaF/FlaG flagellin family)